MSEAKKVSIVIPVYNEEEVLPKLFPQLATFMDTMPHLQFEVILVDDGSGDRSLQMLIEQHHGDNRFKVVSLSRNFGHQIALTAGLDHATGDAVVAMDADLQDPLEVSAQMIAEWESGQNIVYGQRIEREGETAFKLATAKGFYRLMGFLTRDATPYEVGDFYLLSRDALGRLKEMREHHRYLRGMIFWIGFQPKAVGYRRAARFAGTTKFSLFRMLRFAIDGIVSSSALPLYLASYAGFATALIAVLLSVWAVIVWFIGANVVRGWASTVIVIMFVSGIQLMTIGILGLYIGRVYDEVRNRPLYVVQTRLL